MDYFNRYISDFEYVIILIRHSLWEICILYIYILKVFKHSLIFLTICKNFSLNVSLHYRASDRIILFIVIHKSLLTYKEKKGKGRYLTFFFLSPHNFILLVAFVFVTSIHILYSSEII